MKLGRNELFFCGSGQKYKKYCLAKEETRRKKAQALAKRSDNVMEGNCHSL